MKNIGNPVWTMGRELDKSRTADNGQQPRSDSYLDGAIDAVWKRDPNATGPQAQDYLKDLIKTVPLFMGGRVALAGAAALGALDQMHSKDGASTQIVDGMLGATKGASTKLLFDKIGGTNTNFVVKGIGMGLTARTLDVGLNRDTYVGSDGQFSLMGGLGNVGATMFSPKQIGADALLAGIGLSAMSRMNPGIAESRFLGNVFTGTVFGASSGALQEFNRQTAQGTFDPLGLAKETLIHGGIGGLGAAPGGLQGALRYNAANFGPVPPELGKFNLTRMHSPIETMAETTVQTYAKPKYDSLADFHANGTTRQAIPVREYSVQGHETKIQVPVQYDNWLPKFRAVRDAASLPLVGDQWWRLDHTAKVAGARLQLDMSPMRGRYLPEDLVRGLDMMPDSRLVTELTALPNDAPYRAKVEGYRWGYKGDAIAEMWRGTTRLQFFRPPENWHPDNTMLHEWSHIQQEQNKPAYAAYHAALKIEEYGWDHRDYAKYNVAENWANNSEPLLGASDKEFRTLVDNAPVRSVVLGKALKESLLAVPADKRGANYDRLMERVKYIEANATQPARDALARTGAGEQGKAASIVEEYLTDKMTTQRADEVMKMPWEYDYYRE